MAFSPPEIKIKETAQPAFIFLHIQEVNSQMQCRLKSLCSSETVLVQTI